MDFELTYTKVGDYYIPGLILDEDPAMEKFCGSMAIFAAPASGSINPSCGWCW